MSIGRTILVNSVAFSVAMLPIAGGMARAISHETSLTAPQVDCCPHGKPCEKKTNGCGSMAGCALKCSSFSSAVPAPLAVALTASGLEKPALVVQSFRSPSENPPLPPPRL